MANGRTGGGGARRVLAPLLIGIGALLLTLALAIAFVVVPAQKKTPLDIESTTVTDTVPGAIFVGKNYGGNEPTERNKNRPECRVEGDKKLPMTCFIDNQVPMFSQRHVVAVDPSDAEQITFQAAQTLMRAEQGGSTGVEALVNATVDRVTTDRTSAQPVGDASTLQMISSGDPTKDPAPTPFARAGVQYKFPFDTTADEYQYFDSNTFTTNPIRFKEESEVDGVKVNIYEQKLGPIDMWQSIRAHFAATGDTENAERILASYRIRDLPAERWGLPGDPQRKVDMRRYYTNTRTLSVNPQTGQILHGKEDIYQFFAENEQAATAFFRDKAGLEKEKATPTRTAVRFAAGWNTATVDTATERAQKSLDKIVTLGRTLPLVLGVLGLLSLAAGLVLGLRGGGRGARSQHSAQPA